MKADNKTLLEMLAEIAEHQWQPGDLTVPIVMAEFGVGASKAKSMLEQLEKTGAVEMVWGSGPNQKRCKIWRKVS